LQAHDVMASLSSEAQIYDVQLEGEVTSEALTIGQQQYLKQKPLILQGKIRFLQPDKKWEIGETEITINQSTFLLSGYYRGSDNTLDISLKVQDTNIQTVLSLLPEDISQKFRKYQSKGEIYFEGRIIGSVATNENPEIHVNFGCRNASFFHPSYQKGIEGVYLSGNFHSAKANDLSKATLSLKDVRGVMESGSNGITTIWWKPSDHEPGKLSCKR